MEADIVSTLGAYAPVSDKKTRTCWRHAHSSWTVWFVTEREIVAAADGRSCTQHSALTPAPVIPTVY